jgi:hypothetical protein
MATSSDAQAPCPATLGETIGAACTVYGSVCGPTITCGLFEFSVFCTCDGSSFQCTDGQGNPVDTADAATCPVPVDGGATCPATESAAQLEGCQSSGLLCAYPSSCPSSFDECECFPGQTRTGGFGLRFECQPNDCSDAAGVVLDAGSASSSDADSGPYADSAAEGSSSYVDSGPNEDSSIDAASDAIDSSVEASGIDSTIIDASSDGDASTAGEASAGDATPD